MTDSVALRNRVKDSGLKYKYIAQQMGLTPYGLAKKIDNKSEFTVSEIAKLSIILKLNRDAQRRIFFATNVAV